MGAPISDNGLDAIAKIHGDLRLLVFELVGVQSSALPSTLEGVLLRGALADARSAVDKLEAAFNGALVCCPRNETSGILAR